MATVELTFFPDKFSTTDFLSRTDQNKLYSNTGTFDIPVFSEFGPAEPAGIIKMFAGLIAEIPQGYLRCDGAEISRTTFSVLFTAIGTEWGVGDGSTTFDLPDFETNNSFPRAASQDSEIADAGGLDDVTLTVAQMPSHTHIQDAHSHTGASGNTAGSGAHPTTSGAQSPQGTSSTVAVNQPTGGGASHENKPPFATVFFIIKT